MPSPQRCPPARSFAPLTAEGPSPPGPGLHEEPGEVLLDFRLVPRPVDVVLEQLKADEAVRAEAGDGEQQRGKEHGAHAGDGGQPPQRRQREEHRHPHVAPGRPGFQLLLQHGPEGEDLHGKGDHDKGVEGARQAGGQAHRGEDGHVEGQRAGDDGGVGTVVKEDEVAEEHESRHGVDGVRADGLCQRLQYRREAVGEGGEHQRALQVGPPRPPALSPPGPAVHGVEEDVAEQGGDQGRPEKPLRAQHPRVHVPPGNDKDADAAQLLHHRSRLEDDGPVPVPASVHVLPQLLQEPLVHVVIGERLPLVQHLLPPPPGDRLHLPGPGGGRGVCVGGGAPPPYTHPRPRPRRLGRAPVTAQRTPGRSGLPPAGGSRRRTGPLPPEQAAGARRGVLRRGRCSGRGGTVRPETPPPPSPGLLSLLPASRLFLAASFGLGFFRGVGGDPSSMSGS